MRRLAFAVFVVPFFSGCITLFSKTEVVREGETRRTIVFDDPEADKVFHEAVKARSPSLGGTYVGGPFVTLYMKERHLSEDAHFNDCAARCDTNRDGIITLAEATAFAKLKN